MKLKYEEEVHIDVVNFVWIGSPAFNRGGHDVAGIASISENFKKHNQQNPLVFWCQDNYKQQYQNFFIQQGINATVKSIDEHLEQTIKNTSIDYYTRQQCIHTLAIYKKLLSTERMKRVDLDVQIKDRVRIKNILFMFLMATQGGYVLDTNVRAASKNKKVNFPSFDTFHFPWIVETGNSGMPELWMFYSPPHALSRARRTFKEMMDCYRISFEKNLYSEKFGTGNMAIRWLTLGLPEHKHVFEKNIWEAFRQERSNDFCVYNMNVIKEYYNSHYKNSDERYSSAQSHAIYAQIERIKEDIKYGINPKTFLRHPRNSRSKMNYDAQNESLLHIVTRQIRGSGYPIYLKCAKIYLKHGADPNAIYHYTRLDDDGEPLISSERCPLFDVIRLNSLEGLVLLLKYNADVTQSINHKTMLMWAIHYDFEQGVSELLKHAANPNQRAEQDGIHPLQYALKKGNPIIVKMLLENGANIDAIKPSRRGINKACKEVLLSFTKEKEHSMFITPTTPAFYKPVVSDHPLEKETSLETGFQKSTSEPGYS